MRKCALAFAVILSLASGAQAAQWQDMSSIKDILKEAAAQSSEIPDLQGQAEGPTLYAYERAPMGFTSKTFKGELKLVPGVNVILKAVKGGAIRLVDGPITLVYGKPGAADFFTRQRSVALTQEGLTAALPARSDEFRSFGDFSTSPGAGEVLMLKGTQATTEAGQYEREASHSCTYSGYCYGSGLNSKGEFSYSWGFHISCSGSRKVRELVTKYRTVKTVSLLSLPERAEVGVITGAPEHSERAKTLENLSSCH